MCGVKEKKNPIVPPQEMQPRRKWSWVAWTVSKEHLSSGVIVLLGGTIWLTIFVTWV